MLHLPRDNKLLSTDEIRPWLDAKAPDNSIPERSRDLAVAIAQLVLTRIHTSSHLDIPDPPMLAAGLVTPLPASLTGDQRDIDGMETRKTEAWNAVEEVIGDEWALEAR